MEAASRELRDWELQTARARNEGTFFKGLFKADVLQPSSDESRAAYEREPLQEVGILAPQMLIIGWWDAAELLIQRACTRQVLCGSPVVRATGFVNTRSYKREPLLVTDHAASEACISSLCCRQVRPYLGVPSLCGTISCQCSCTSLKYA